MGEFFLEIVNMSITASWIILAVVVLRLILKKAPKWMSMILWGIVGLRLVLPFSFESIFSLIPSAQTISKVPDAPRPSFQSGVPVVDQEVNEYLQSHYFEGVTRPTGHFVDITTVLAMVWLAGIAVLVLYSLISYWRVKRKVATAVLLRDNIYQSENVGSPFVLGIFAPKIYLPFAISEQDREQVIAHEAAHIHRRDYLWKPLGFFLLTLHWFNPLIWLSYVLLCRDIELACDEKVIKNWDDTQKAEYSQALLNCSVHRRLIAACPLAFGEVSVKNRVKSVLHYKKPAFWIVVVSVVVSIAVAVCFLTNPPTDTLQGEKVSFAIKKTTIPAQQIDWYKKSYFFENGQCYLQYNQQKDGAVVVIDKNGEIVQDGLSSDSLPSSVPLLERGEWELSSWIGRVIGEKTVVVQTGTPENYQQWLYSIDGQLLCDEPFTYISYFYNGLALIEQNEKLGVIDEDGNILLSPSLKYDAMIEVYGEDDSKSRQYQPQFMNEDTFVVAIDGYVAVIAVQRYDESGSVISNDTTISKNQKLLYEQFLAGEKTALDADGKAKTLEEFVLHQKLEDDFCYTFLDMTDDGIPELCVKSIELYFFTIKDGELHHWYTETNTYCKLLNNGDLLFERHGGAPDHINYEYYKLDANASKTTVITFSWWDKTTLDGEDYPEFYEINGEEVTKEAYQEKTTPYLAVGTDNLVWYDKNGKRIETVGSGITGVGSADEPSNVTIQTNDLITAVLENREKFVTEEGETCYLNDYQMGDPVVTNPKGYTFVDFDGDGKQEAVIYISESHGFYLVLHSDNSQVFGHVFSVRALQSLKTDGTFVGSGGAGLHYYHKMHFENNKPVITDEAIDDELAENYQINGKTVTKDEMDQFTQKWYQKQDVQWFMYFEEDNGTLKTFRDAGVSFQVPSGWGALEQQGEDGRTCFFRDPTLGEQCQLTFSVTGSEYQNNRTKSEYLEYLSERYEDVKISSYEQESLSGYEGTKIVATYAENNKTFIRVGYDNVVSGVRMYDFTITYPKAQEEIYKGIFDSILQSVVIE